jgi:SAM-dependent methyltransferase
VQPRLQRRIQRYGWDLAAATYESLWQAQLAPAQAQLMACAGLTPGERVLDVACGTGVVTFDAAAKVAPDGMVIGVDLSGRMIDVARQRARIGQPPDVRFERMDAERLELPDGGFDVVLCSLGLMYMPSPDLAMLEMRRMLRPGGRMILAVWGERSRCGWAELFPIVNSEITSDVCPLFFHLGQGDSLEGRCADAGFQVALNSRVSVPLIYANDDQACDAAFVGGPVALAWSRLDEAARARVRNSYLDSIAKWQRPDGTYHVPGEFVIVAAGVPDRTAPI